MSKSELLELVWELTREVWSLLGSKDAELPMDRNIAVLKRKSKSN